MNVRQVARTLAKLTALRFFPVEPGARRAVLEIVCHMATDETQVEWLVNRMLSIYDSWPGPREMRACFGRRFRPADEIEVSSSIFGEDLTPWPPDATARPSHQIAAAPIAALPPGNIASADAQMEQGIRVQADNPKRRSILGGPATATEIARAPAWLRHLEGYDK